MEPLTVLIRVAIGALILCNVGALIFAFLRFRATRDLPPTLPERIEPPVDGNGVSPSARLSDLERELQSIQRAFNDLHTTVETRHRSLSGLISKKLGPRQPREEADESDEPLSMPKNAYQQLAELEAQQAPPPIPPQQNQRRHLRRF